MKRLIVILAVVVVVAVSLGFYRGWFTMSTDSGLDNNKVEINLTVDPDKAREDAEEAVDNVVPDSLDATEESTSDAESNAAPSDGSPENESTNGTRENNDNQ
jgi:hypothetical protein